MDLRIVIQALYALAARLTWPNSLPPSIHKIETNTAQPIRYPTKEYKPAAKSKSIDIP
jgi:hypothetical protein